MRGRRWEGRVQLLPRNQSSHRRLHCHPRSHRLAQVYRMPAHPLRHVALHRPLHWLRSLRPGLRRLCRAGACVCRRVRRGMCCVRPAPPRPRPRSPRVPQLGITTAPPPPVNQQAGRVHRYGGRATATAPVVALDLRGVGASCRSSRHHGEGDMEEVEVGSCGSWEGAGCGSARTEATDYVRARARAGRGFWGAALRVVGIATSVASVAAVTVAAVFAAAALNSVGGGG